MTYILLILGFLLLIKGANYLVEGASALAKRLKVSDLVIGLTIVAFGTSTPELVVNIIASLKGNTDIAIGNILGSNIANIFFILGISAIICPLIISKNTVWKEIPLSLLATVVLGVLSNDTFINGAPNSILNRSEGIIFIFFFIIFLYYIFGIAKDGIKESIEKKEEAVKEHSLSILAIYIVGGLFGLVLGGKWIVDSAVTIATHLGVSEALIGLTVVAIGTSLPELATSAIAAYKKNADIAIGNIVGSNIFNIFWILGISAIIKPLPFDPARNLDVLMTIFASLLLFIFAFTQKKRSLVFKQNVLERWEGILFVAIYISYIIYLILRG